MNAKTDKKQGQTIEQLAQEMNWTLKYTDEIENTLYHDMLVSMYRREPLEFEQQKMLEASQNKIQEYEKAMPTLLEAVNASDKELKELKRKRAREGASLGRSISQIKEDLIALGYLKEDSPVEEVRQAIKEEQDKMLDVAETVADFDFDIEVLSKENKILHERKQEFLKGIEEEKEAVDYWVDLQAYNMDMNEKVSKAYKELTGIPFDKNLVASPAPMFLQGIPGQGKTAVYASAAKRVCKKLKLNFIKNLSENYQPMRNDFVMVVQECAGETSGLLFAGLPKSEEIEIHKQKRFALTKAFNKRFLGFETAAGGCLLFDDLSNTTMNIQNIMLPIMQNKSFAGMLLSNCLVGATGNLGSIDQTHINAMSMALKTRVTGALVADRVDNFIQRVQERFNDEYGTCGIDNFLKQFPDNFSRIPDSERTPLAKGYPCSRTYEDLIILLRNTFMQHGGRGKGEEGLLNEIQDQTTAKLGNDVADDVTTYLRSYFSGTNELALKFINANDAKELEEAKVAFDTFNKENGGAGVNALSHFHEFTSSLVDHTISKLMEYRNSPDKQISEQALELATKKFAAAILVFPDSFLGTAMSTFNVRLSNLDTEYAMASPTGQKALLNETCIRLSTVFAETKGITKSKKEVISAQLSGFSKMNNNVDVPTIKTSTRNSLID